MTIKKAIILAGGQGTTLAPLTNYSPTWMLPILNKPLIQYTVDFLIENGFKEIIITLPEENHTLGFLEINKMSGVTIRYHRENRPRGTAGALKDLEHYCNEPFFVINSNVFIGQLDLDKFIQFHCDTGAKVTIGVFRDNDSNGTSENVEITEDRMVERFHIIHSSMDKRTLRKFSGMYLFDPSIFKFISQKKYMDIKEQLIPALQEEAIPIYAYEVKEFHRCISSTYDYIDLHRSTLMKRSHTNFDGEEEIAQDVWVGKDVEISPKSYLLGPILIGDGTRIKDGAQIIGPSVIGSECLISESTLVRESILWDRTSLLNRSKIEYSIVGGESCIPDEYHIKNMIVLNGTRIKDANLIPSGYNIKGIASTKISTHKTFKILKRIIDVALSATGLIVLFPFLVLIALAIKFDSRGPVLYKQKRCGTGGHLFNMLKFRTMVANAEQLHKQLSSKNEHDGPMFKMTKDPRVTKVGEILRKTSFDEFPQLFNVLKGEMSLVGPRPLIMDEMKFSPGWRDIRLKVKPGITGLWQIHGRSDSPFHDWIQYDVYYVKHQSIWLDVKILFKTIKVVFKKVGAY